MLLFVVAGFFACSTDGDDSEQRNSSGEEDDDNSEDNDDDVIDDDTADDDDDFNMDDLLIGDDSKYNVIIEKQIGSDWDCETLETCMDDYLDTFLNNADVMDHSVPTDMSYWEEMMSDIDDDLIDVLPEGSLTENELREVVFSMLNIDWLVEELDNRLLSITIIREEEKEFYFEWEMLLVDPYIGTFRGIFLLPKGMGSFPGIVALHGHTSSALEYRDDYWGKDYATNGYAVFLPDMRVAGGPSGEENIVQREFMINGYWFQTVRVYEALLVYKFLRFLNLVENENFSIIGHSGGALTANLVMRVDFDIKAIVVDIHTDYTAYNPTYDYWADGTVLTLYPYHVLTQPLNYYKTEGQGEAVPGYDTIDDLDDTVERPMWQAEYELATDRQQVEKVIDYYDFYIP